MCISHCVHKHTVTLKVGSKCKSCPKVKTLLGHSLHIWPRRNFSHFLAFFIWLWVPFPEEGRMRPEGAWQMAWRLYIMNLPPNWSSYLPATPRPVPRPRPRRTPTTEHFMENCHFICICWWHFAVATILPLSLSSIAASISVFLNCSLSFYSNELHNRCHGRKMLDPRF